MHNGGQLLDCHKVTGLVPGPVVTVETDKGSFKAKKVIVTAGAWANDVLKTTGLTLPMKVSIPISNKLCNSLESLNIYCL